MSVSNKEVDSATSSFVFDSVDYEEKIHKRETTAEMLSRIGDQFHLGREEDEKEVCIEDINADLNEDELNPLPIATKLQFDSESDEGAFNIIECLSNIHQFSKENENNPKDGDDEVDKLWNLHVENVKLESDTEDSRLEEIKADQTKKVLDNPFLKKLLDTKSFIPPIIKCEPEQFLLHSILLGNYQIHTRVVSDYTLRQHLYWYERSINSK